MQKYQLWVLTETVIVLNMLVLVLWIEIFGNNVVMLENRKNISIFTSANDRYVNITVVALTSLFESGKPNTFYKVHILAPKRFNPENEKKFMILKKIYKNYMIEFVEMGDKFRNAPRFSPTYYRLGISNLFPNIKKCIYLDGDVIVRHDLSKMFGTNMDKFYVAGVIDNFVYSKEEAIEKAKVLEIPDLSQYICCGVLIMNLENMRRDGIEEKFSKFLREKKKYLVKMKLFCVDQDIINPVCFGRILCLPIEYGLMINLKNRISDDRVSNIYDDCEKKDPIIVHFNSHGKPWKEPDLSLFHKEWNYYANVFNDFMFKGERNLVPKKKN